MDEKLQELIRMPYHLATIRRRKGPCKEEQVTINFAFSCVCSIKKISKGETLSMKNIWVKRPGTGNIAAKHFKDVIGKKAKRNIPEDEQLSWEDFE